jgi:hypothetical protein
VQETKREANSLDVSEGTSYLTLHKKLQNILKYNPGRFEEPVFQKCFWNY